MKTDRLLYAATVSDFLPGSICSTQLHEASVKAETMQTCPVESGYSILSPQTQLEIVIAIGFTVTNVGTSS